MSARAVATASVCLALVAASCRGSGAASTARPGAEVSADAPLAKPSSSVRVIGGSPRVRRAVRTILRGFDRTAVRRIEIDRRGQGLDFEYTVAAPARARRNGVVAMRGLWEAGVVDAAYARLRGPLPLPRLAWDGVAVRYPDGRVQGLGGDDLEGATDTAAPPPPAPQRIRRFAEGAGFELTRLRYLHVAGLPALPVAVLATHDHRALADRLDRFYEVMDRGDDAALSYVELDSRCGRPVFARGRGVATDPQWFDPCAFMLGCVSAFEQTAPRRTYPC